MIDTHPPLTTVLRRFASKNKEVEVEEHPRNLLLSKNKKRMSSECNNIKLAIQNDKLEVVCAMCKKCLITTNHDVRVLNYVNDMNSHGKKQKVCCEPRSQRKRKQGVKLTCVAFGMDVLKVREVAMRAIRRARRCEGPLWLNARHRGLEDTLWLTPMSFVTQFIFCYRKGLYIRRPPLQEVAEHFEENRSKWSSSDRRSQHFQGRNHHPVLKLESCQTYKCGIAGEPVSDAHGEYVSVNSRSRKW
ncbi:hypothetical protein Tco_1254099 [Tanacetum coccineum]